MAELSVTDRLQPSLLDRLIDDDPGNVNESRDKRVLSMRALRAAVLRDLRALLNATAIDAIEDLTDYPLAARSVINYGLMDLSGKTSSSVSVDMLERVLRQAIWDFEPRVVRDSVQIKVLEDESDLSGNRMLFELRGEIWGQPLPERIFLKTELDLDLGDVKVTDVTGGVA